MVKRFKTAEGKRMKVRMTPAEISENMFFHASMIAGGLLISFLIWGAI